MNEDMLKILVCPETRQPLRPAATGVVESLNRRIKEGAVKNHGGQVVEEPLDGGFVREDGKRLYPIRHEIPILLIDEAIELSDGEPKD